MQSTNDYYPLDFRLVASTYFQGLAFLCHTSNKTIVDTLEQLLSITMIANQVQPQRYIDSYVGAMTDQFRDSMVTTVSLVDRFVSLTDALKTVAPLNDTTTLSHFPPSTLILIRTGSASFT